MSSHAAIQRLMLRWQESRERGEQVSAEDLCKDCPNLLPELRQRIEALEGPGSRGATRADFFIGTTQDAAGDDATRLALRPRLLWAATAFLVLCTLGVLYPLAGGETDVGAGLLGVFLLIVIALAALCGTLRRVADLTLRQLRFLELALIALVALLLALEQTSYLSSARLHDLLQSERRQAIWTFYLDSMSLPWVLLILIYGTYIPNGWRRTALVVSLLASIPFVLGLFTTLHHPNLGLRLLPAWFWSAALWLGSAVVMATYGAHRIDTARQKELEARKLGQYRLVRRLGRGGMGEVHLAEHQMLRRPCAVKLIRPDRGNDVRRLLRFEREVQAMASLGHPNVAEVYDYGHTHDGMFYYVMEHVPGLDLDELVSRHGPLPPERAVHLLRQVCAALRAAHRAGLIHRDIKPGNILVCERGQTPDVVKLVDFGLVRDQAGEALDAKLTQEGTVVGTPLFMAPEQIAGAADLDARTDLYSVGIVAYYLLTGRNPFDRATLRQIFAAHLHEPPPPPPSVFNPAIGADLEAIVLRCLAKAPADRHASAEALDQALAACSLAEPWTEMRAAGWWSNVKRGGNAMSP